MLLYIKPCLFTLVGNSCMENWQKLLIPISQVTGSYMFSVCDIAFSVCDIAFSVCDIVTCLVCVTL